MLRRDVEEVTKGCIFEKLLLTTQRVSCRKPLVSRLSASVPLPAVSLVSSILLLPGTSIQSSYNGNNHIRSRENRSSSDSQLPDIYQCKSFRNQFHRFDSPRGYYTVLRYTKVNRVSCNISTYTPTVLKSSTSSSFTETLILTEASIHHISKYRGMYVTSNVVFDDNFELRLTAIVCLRAPELEIQVW